VVLVTTKRGKTDSKPTFTYDAYIGSSEATLLPDMVTDAVQYAELRNEAHTNFGTPAYFSEEQIAGFRAQSDKISTDWLDLIFDTAPIQQHNLGVSGGSEKTNYRFSLGYLDQEGVMINSDFQRLNARLNLDTRVSDRVKLGTSISYVRGDRSSPFDNLADLGSLFTHAVQALPTSPPYDDQGRYAEQNPEFGNSSRRNPLTEAEAFNFSALNEDILANAYIQWEPVTGLTLKGTGAINSRDQKSNSFNAFIPSYDWITGELRGVNNLRSANNSHWQSFNYTVWLTAQYEKSFGDHNLTALAGYSEEENEYESFGAFRNGHLSNAVQVLNVGLSSSSTNNGSATGWGLRSYFGRINYNFRDKYLFEANVRFDGSSRFSDDKWGTFPSVSAGWVISQEDFFVNMASVDFLKIRASWGQLGNQNIGNFAFARSLSLSQGYNFGGTVVSGVAQTSLGNPALSWETATMTDIGVDISLFNSISLTADYFIRTTEDVLFNVPISALTGFSSQISNASTVENKGWELSLTYDRTMGDFEFALGGNVTHVTSEVVTLNPNIEIGDVDRLISGRRITERGSPLNAFFGLENDGIFQSQAEIDAGPDHSGLNSNFGPGDLRFKDQNGDGVIDADDRVVLGQEDPVLMYGFNFRAKFKGFDLAAIFQGAADFQSYGGEELSDPFFNNAGLPALWVDRWTPENTGAAMPRLYFSTGPSNSMANSFYVYDRSYFRLKNLQIGYTIPDSVMEKISFTGGRVYVNGSNLFTVTDFPYFDPERPSGADRGATGFPNIKVLSAGVSLSF
jgi:TonB-linked SusC/RagA family outer membrane protein